MLQSFKLAIKSIWSNKMRSFLTMLGIIIGIASFVLSIVGNLIGIFFGKRFNLRMELFGGLVLIGIGVKSVAP